MRTIYKELFGPELGSPVDALKRKFPQLEEMDVVDAWVLWPLEKGGLGLINPYIGVVALRKTCVEIGDEDHFKKLLSEDKVLFDQIYQDRSGNRSGIWKGFGKFLSGKPNWAEFVAGRETSYRFRHWHQRYQKLLERPPPKAPSASTSDWTSELSPSSESDEGSENEAENYANWLLTYYQQQLVFHFGTVDFINYKLLPRSMINYIQKSKVLH